MVQVLGLTNAEEKVCLLILRMTAKVSSTVKSEKVIYSTYEYVLVRTYV